MTLKNFAAPLTAVLLSTSATVVMAGEEETVSIVDTYTCEQLVGLEYENVPTAVYYIEGFSDSGDVPIEEITEDDFTSVPVEQVYNYCYANPTIVVSDVIDQFDDEA